jgi:hypothetical protein
MVESDLEPTGREQSEDRKELDQLALNGVHHSFQSIVSA